MRFSSTARSRTAFRALAVALVCTTGLPLLAQSSLEDRARQQLEAAKDYLRKKDYPAGLRELDEIRKIYSSTAVAGDALLEEARYWLEVKRDYAKARDLTDTLRTKYKDSDSFPLSYVLDGRSALLAGRSPEDVKLAIQQFEKVPRFKGNAAIPEAMYRAAAASRIAGDAPDAVRRYADLATRYPTSEWTANALLESALALLRAGQPPSRAMEQLQRVRNKFPQLEAASTKAQEWNTILYRLYLRAQTQPAYQRDERTVGETAAKFRDVTSLAVNNRNELLVVTKNGVSVYPTRGAPLPFVASREPRSVFFDRDGGVLSVQELGVSDSKGTPVPLEMPIEGDHPLKLKLTDAVMTALGEYLLADDDRQTIYRFNATGKPAGAYATKLRVRRLAINDLDEVSTLGEKTVTILRRDGKTAGVIAEQGANYKLQDPSDICVDPFGHIYVLDRSTVFVFSPDGKKALTSFVLPKTVQPQHIAVNSSGLLYVYDSKSDAIQIYR